MHWAGYRQTFRISSTTYTDYVPIHIDSSERYREKVYFDAVL
ncbi:hypothetical protein NC652_002376 [Populus alba x Populus x berolinensis]|nr:hypothetical protein NC652_002376 [Populus alba x Populus x berolinensis]